MGGVSRADDVLAPPAPQSTWSPWQLLNNDDVNLCLCSLSCAGWTSLASNYSGLYHVPKHNCLPSSTLIAADLGAILHYILTSPFSQSREICTELRNSAL
eukprot:1138790-Pelagomonas_calceolata.AAC.5